MKKKIVYGHMEVAVLFFPHILPKSASRQLRNWIQRDEELLGDLLRAGYVNGQRLYSPMQVKIIFDHLGDPETWNIR